MLLQGVSDTSLFYWDRRLGKYVGNVKMMIRQPDLTCCPGPGMRCRAMMESDDLIHWTRPRMTFYPDGLDDWDSQIYSHYGVHYGSMWLGFLQVMHTERRSGWKQCTLELTASQDGRHWTRVNKREEILQLGADDAWDADKHGLLSEPVLIGDELWMYYTSMRVRRAEPWCKAIGLSRLRRDGFVSLDAGNKPGTVTTRPLSFTGKRFFVNAEVRNDGWIKLGLLTPIDFVPNYFPDDCIPIRGDGVTIPVSWKNAKEFELPAGEHVRLVFQLKNARLYSFWIE